MNTKTDIPLRILVVDDNTAIHEDFRKILGSQSPHRNTLDDLAQVLFAEPSESAQAGTFRVDYASQGQEALALLEAALKANDPYALAFVDVRMPPGWDGVETIEHFWAACPDLQVVVCTAYSDYSWKDMVQRFGQKDNLLVLKKPFEMVEVLQLAHALTRKWLLGRQAQLRMDELERMAQERAEKLCQEAELRTRAQNSLRLSEERFIKAFQSSPMPMAIQSRTEGCLLAFNPSFLQLTGYAADEIRQRWGKDLHLWEDEAALNDCLKPEGRLRHYACVLRRRDGTPRNIMLGAEPLPTEDQPCVLMIAEDVTERLRLEAGMRQAQKLEVVGRLAAGVAHEFNNVLAIVQGHAGLLQAELTGNQRLTDYTDRILQASQRAANFTRQLLGVSRPQPVNFKAVNLRHCVQRVQQLLEQTLGDRHPLSLVLADQLPCIHADECNVDQVLINLILNARDAMSDGGPILVGAGAVNLTPAYARGHEGAKAGPFVCLAVNDRGCGISPENISRIFDPFFTTKAVGKGTGLGLSTVQNIIRRHGGWIELASDVGKGSSFKVFFPVWAGLVPAQEASESGEQNGSAEITSVARSAAGANVASVKNGNAENLVQAPGRVNGRAHPQKNKGTLASVA